MKNMEQNTVIHTFHALKRFLSKMSIAWTTRRLSTFAVEVEKSVSV